MFKILSKGFFKIFNSFRKKTFLTKKDISENIIKIRLILLKADVSLEVVRNFILNIKKKSILKENINFLTPTQLFLDIVYKELLNIIDVRFSNIKKKINVNNKLPIIILIAGLQGAGKTTTVGKLAKYYKINNKKKILTVTLDVYRPAAFIQLKILSKQANVNFYDTKSILPFEIAVNAIKYGYKYKYDIIIFDTAGRLSINIKMMKELKSIYNIINPSETLLVIDSMLGQDSINIVSTFNSYIFLSGIILTKLDSDTKGGVVLSVTQKIKKPIKFIGISEKIDGLKVFNAELMSKRILGIDNKTFTLINKIKKNNFKKNINYEEFIDNFNLNDFKLQISKMKNVNFFSSFFSRFLNVFKIKKNILNKEKFLKKILLFEVIINSMTLKERKFPNIIKESRKKRIALGAGVKIQDVNELLIQFNFLKKTIKNYSNFNIKNLMKEINNIFNIF